MMLVLQPPGVVPCLALSLALSSRAVGGLAGPGEPNSTMFLVPVIPSARFVAGMPTNQIDSNIKIAISNGHGHAKEQVLMVYLVSVSVFAYSDAARPAGRFPS